VRWADLTQAGVARVVIGVANHAIELDTCIAFAWVRSLSAGEGSF